MKLFVQMFFACRQTHTYTGTNHPYIYISTEVLSFENEIKAEEYIHTIRIVGSKEQAGQKDKVRDQTQKAVKK